jgi:quinol monooxygenase YgiN
MARLIEMDELVSFSKQIEEDVNPIVLINKFDVRPEDVDQFIKAWEKHATYFRSQPGCISAQLHQGIGGSGVFVNYGVWESTTLYKKAHGKINLHDLLSDYPPSTVVSPHIFKKVAV